MESVTEVVSNQPVEPIPPMKSAPVIPRLKRKVPVPELGMAKGLESYSCFDYGDPNKITMVILLLMLNA